MNKALAIIGFIAFALGLLLAIIFGIVPISDTVTNIIVIILLVLGLIIGFFNITAREMIPLLVAIIALVVVGNVFQPISAFGIGAVLDRILGLIATLMAPAAVIAAIRVLVSVGFPKD
jgi:hypothetical protein